MTTNRWRVVPNADKPDLARIFDVGGNARGLEMPTKVAQDMADANNANCTLIELERFHADVSEFFQSKLPPEVVDPNKNEAGYWQLIQLLADTAIAQIETYKSFNLV